MENSNPDFGSNRYALVADIGGTNARFSRVNLKNLQVDKIAVYASSSFDNLLAAISHYRDTQELAHVKQAAIAIACPVSSDRVSMTNLHWEFSIHDLQRQLGLSELQVINDFAAAALSMPYLTPEEKIQVGAGNSLPQQPMVVLGAGTGLGVAFLIPHKKGFIPVASEAGHSNWAAQNEQEWFIYQYLSKKYGHVSLERVLSGGGLKNIYQALALLREEQVPSLGAADIVNEALNHVSSLARETVVQFLAILGSVAGDLALSLASFGGVYIAGGIAPKLLDFFPLSEFRSRFESKGRFTSFNRQIATYIVMAEQPGLIGAALSLKFKKKQGRGDVYGSTL